MKKCQRMPCTTFSMRFGKRKRSSTRMEERNLRESAKKDDTTHRKNWRGIPELITANKVLSTIKPEFARLSKEGWARWLSAWALLFRLNGHTDNHYWTDSWLQHRSLLGFHWPWKGIWFCWRGSDMEYIGTLWRVRKILSTWSRKYW